MVFIDNFSRFSWLYPLKLKSDVLSKFKIFQQQSENWFNQRISIFQSDGGREFVNQEFSSHLMKCGIKHYLSCPHTPEQNGLAERKHRHITELKMSMMFQGHLPPTLWVGAFLTANFIINLLPSSVHNKAMSPYEQIRGRASDYSSLRVLGCVCYPYLKPYSHHKFDPKSLMCVFLGYSEQYKGYRYLYPPTGRVYLSRHVVFHEENFPFVDVYKHYIPQAETPLLQAWCKRSGEQEDLRISSEKKAKEEEEIPTKHIGKSDVSTIPMPASPTQQVSGDTNMQHEEDHSDSTSEEDMTVMPTSSQLEQITETTHLMIWRRKACISKPNPR